MHEREISRGGSRFRSGLAPNLTNQDDGAELRESDDFRAVSVAIQSEGSGIEGSCKSREKRAHAR